MINEINQNNLYLLLPSKISWLATMLAEERTLLLSANTGKALIGTSADTITSTSRIDKNFDLNFVFIVFVMFYLLVFVLLEVTAQAKRYRMSHSTIQILSTQCLANIIGESQISAHLPIVHCT